jgi:hypothetical protein
MAVLAAGAQPLYVGSYNIRYQNNDDKKNGNGWEKRCQVVCDQLNFEHPDEVTQCVNVIPETLQQHFDMFLSNSFGFGGTNSTLIIKDL